MRELYEETGVQADSDDVRLFDVLSAPDGTVLIFGVLPGITATAVPDAPTDETTGWELINGPAELAFPLHTRVAATYFSRAVAAAR